MIKFFNSLLDAYYEKQLRKERVVDLSTPADYLYPPPSAYEVKRINEEYQCDSHCVTAVGKTMTHSIKGLINGN